MARALAVVVCASTLLAGCFGASHPSPAPPPPAQLPPAPHAAVELIRTWSSLLDDGLVQQAAALFAVPSVVQNVGRPMRLTSYRQVRDFIASLPCGARPARTYARGRYVVAVSVLVDRPGMSCGVSYGHEIQTEFLIANGEIAEWRALNEPIPSGT